MATSMETWLIADAESLAGFFKNGFNPSKLPNSIDLESISKEQVLQSLKSATKASSKGEYSKGKLSYATLRCVDLSRIKLKQCQRFVNRLKDGV